MSDVEKTEDFIPDWKKIYDLTDRIDDQINTSIEKDKLSFLEVDLAIFMVKEKMMQEKVLALYRMKEEHLEETPIDDKKPTNMYG